MSARVVSGASALGAFFLCSAAIAQSANPPSFALADVHSSTGKGDSRASLLASGRYRARNVIDQTGLNGAYDFTLSWTRSDLMRAAQNRRHEDDSGGDPTGAITVFDAIEHQLGLKFQLGKRVSASPS